MIYGELQISKIALIHGAHATADGFTPGILQTDTALVLHHCGVSSHETRLMLSIAAGADKLYECRGVRLRHYAVLRPAPAPAVAELHSH